MMFKHLKTTKNKIIVYEEPKSRDGSVITRLQIGTAYGAFRSLTEEEMKAPQLANYASVGMLVFYTPDETIAEGTLVDSGGVPANPKTHYYPKKGDLCTWRGTEYYVSGVSAKPDIRGDIEGYLVYCKNG